MWPDGTDLEAALRNVRTIVMEADMPCPQGGGTCANYTEWGQKLESIGFKKVATVQDEYIDFIQMMVFQRRTAEHSRPHFIRAKHKAAHDAAAAAAQLNV